MNNNKIFQFLLSSISVFWLSSYLNGFVGLSAVLKNF